MFAAVYLHYEDMIAIIVKQITVFVEKKMNSIYQRLLKQLAPTCLCNKIATTKKSVLMYGRTLIRQVWSQIYGTYTYWVITVSLCLQMPDGLNALGH